MASTSETGHAKNVANLKTMISRCTGYAARYNPTNPLIILAALQTLYNLANAALTALNIAKAPYTKAVNARQIIFAEMEKLATRILNAFDATHDVTDKMVDDAKTIIRKIRGERKSKRILNPLPEDPVQISVSQQSYDMQVQHYNKLVALVTAETTYDPNETELKPDALTAFGIQLQTIHDAAINATTPYLQALATRNKVLYTEKTGLVDVAAEVKKYVKSVKAITLPEFRQISGLRFTRPKKKK